MGGEGEILAVKGSAKTTIEKLGGGAGKKKGGDEELS